MASEQNPDSLAANLAMLERVLDTLTDVLDIREVFHRVSEAAQPVLPHDLLGVLEIIEDGTKMRLHATSKVGQPSFVVPILESDRARTEWGVILIQDFNDHPEYADMPAVKADMRSMIGVPVRFAGKLQARINIFSRQPSRFSLADLPIAQRLASHVALAMSHHQLAEEAKQRHALEERAVRLEARVRTLTDELDARSGYRRIIGESVLWRQVLTQATQVAATDATVLLLGESGTGKEVIARFIHRASPRKSAPFVALNCAALPEHLLEAELFGFERGAFTGATQSKPGQIEQAAGGVLFLDEVGEMTLPAQVKFLRVLQEREFQRLGGNRIIRADIRVVAATNRDVPKAIERGMFREDLYYRLNVFPIRLPPLRARREDILPMSEAFIQEIGRSLGRPPAGLARDARQGLVDYHWPGNVRELRNMIERAAILADGGLIVRDHFAFTPTAPALAAPAGAVQVPLTTPLDPANSERAMIEKALHDARFNKAKAAKTLGLTRAQLYVRLKRHGLD
jgi:Nif-specific regulatory protein